MAVLAIDSNELDGILLRLRAIMAREENDVPDPGGNPADDQVSAALQDLPDDLSREEVVEERLDQHRGVVREVGAVKGASARAGTHA